MLAYTASRRRDLERRSSPSAMLVVAVVHVAAIAIVMSAKMDLPDKVKTTITRIDFIKEPVPPPPSEPRPLQKPRPSQSILDTPRPITPMPPTNIQPLDTRPMPVPLLGDPIIGATPDPQPPRVDPQPRPLPVRTGPRFATPDHALRPPYPSSKLDSGEEAVLRLRLAIDERGRVTSVEPVGRTDPAFLQAARRHLIAKWRYQPATEGARAIASSTVITLRFELH